MDTGGPIRYSGGFKYQLREDWWCQTAILGQACRIEDADVPGKPWVELASDGSLHVREGYAWDGPSGPTIDTKSFMRGSLAHDCLYQLMRAGKLSQGARREADRTLWLLCRQDGMSRFRAWYVYHSLRLFAGFAAARQQDVVEVAP